MASLFESTRPQRWEDVVGQPKAVAVLRRVKLGGRAVWLSGPSGSGKTTLARLAAASVADPYAIVEIDAQDVSIDFLREMERSFAYRCLGDKGGKCWIINEAHGLRGAILSRFLTLIGALPNHCTLIFTTTTRGQKSLFADFDDANPFISRCLVVPMAWHEYADHQAGPLAQAFAERALAIARAEGLDGRPIGEYVQLALECKHNLRMMLSHIEAGCML